MQTLTAQDFRKKYGIIGESQFGDAEKEQDLFSAIKNDLSNRYQKYGEIINEPGSDALSNVEKGFRGAAELSGGVMDVAGEGLSRIPLVGGALKAIGKGVKSGYDAVTNKLGSTKFMQEAAEGLGNNSNLEKGLSIASSSGDIANNILVADQGVQMAKVGVKTAVKAGKKVVTETANLASKGLDKLGPAGNYVKGAVRDIMPSKQSVMEHELAAALGITPGDLSKIEAKTGNRVGQWIADNNLIGKNKATTQTLIDNFFEENYNSVRKEIGKVDKVYKPTEIPRWNESIKRLASDLESTPGLEKDLTRVQKMAELEKVNLSDVQKLKEMLDAHDSLFNAMGDVRGGDIKRGLANIRGEIKQFIEKEVKDATKTDISVPNNNVATAKELLKTIKLRDPRGVTKSYLNWRDISIGLGLTYFGNPVIGIGAVVAQKIIESPTVRLRVARFLDKLSDAEKVKISQSLVEGKVPVNLQKIVAETEPIKNPLYQEARKYKSAEEFVNKQFQSSNQTSLYQDIRQLAREIKTPDQVDSAVLKKFGTDPEITLYRGTNEGLRPSAFESDTKSKVGRFWSPDKAHSEQFVRDTGKMYEVKVKASDLLKSRLGKNTELAQGEVRLGNELQQSAKESLTKSQLTDIWNKANKIEPQTTAVIPPELQPLAQEARKYKSAEGYVYHGTTEARARQIAEGGLIPGKEAGNTQAKEIFLSNTEQYAKSYADRKGGNGGVVLRIKQSPDMIADLNTGGRGDFKTVKRVSPKDIEIKTKKGWIPLLEYIKNL